jgi:hypothetical protein
MAERSAIRIQISDGRVTAEFRLPAKMLKHAQSRLLKRLVREHFEEALDNALADLVDGTAIEEAARSQRRHRTVPLSELKEELGLGGAG